MDQKPPIPKIDLTMEDVGMSDLKFLSKDELDKIPFDVKYLMCGVGNCISVSKVRDYGMHPVYYWPRSKDPWINIHHQYRICAKHWKMYRKEFRFDLPIPEPCGSLKPFTKEELTEYLKKWK